MDRRQLVVSDLDGTLLGDDAALARFASWYAAARQRVALVYSSGRFVDSVRESVATSELPEPDALIGGLGTQIRCFPTGRELFDWPIASPPLWNTAAIARALKTLPQLERQPEEFQSPYKISYFLHSATADDLSHIAALLRHQGLACELVYSSLQHFDVLPQGVNKGTAALALARHWRLDASSVVACGDTANDLAMFQQGFLSVIVANAHEELRTISGENIYHARRSHADGVLEGVRHWLG